MSVAEEAGLRGEKMGASPEGEAEGQKLEGKPSRGRRWGRGSSQGIRDGSPVTDKLNDRT